MVRTRNSSKLFAVAALCLLAGAAVPAHAHLRGVAAPAASASYGLNRRLALSDQEFSMATDAVKEAVGFVKDQVNGFLQEVKEVEADVKKWKGQWDGLGLVKMPEFQAIVGVAAKKLANANSGGRKAIETIKAKLDTILADLVQVFPNGSQQAKTEAIVKARITLKALLSQAAADMKELSESVEGMQGDFISVHKNAETYSKLIDESIAGRTAAVKRQIAEWRGAAYGTCGAVVAACAVPTLGTGIPVCAAACYGTAAGIVETKIDKLNKSLEINKKAVKRLADKFVKIGNRALELSQTAQDEYDNLSTAAADTGTVVAGFKGDKEARNENMQPTGGDGIFGQTPWDRKAETDTYARRIIANWNDNVIPAMKTLQKEVNGITAEWAAQAKAHQEELRKAFEPMEKVFAQIPDRAKAFWSKCYSGDQDTQFTLIGQECAAKGLQFFAWSRDCADGKSQGRCM